MKAIAWIVPGLALLLTPGVQAAEEVLLALESGTALDSTDNGTFNGLSPSGLVLRISHFTQSAQTTPSRRRAIIEFDLSPYLAAGQVGSATFTADTLGGSFNATNGSFFDFYTFDGDGEVTIEDAEAGDSVAGTWEFPGSGQRFLDLTAAFNDALARGQSYLGLNIRTRSEGTPFADELVLAAINGNCCGQIPPQILIETVVDSDGDGIADATDNCTVVANAAQIDSDGDGIGNRCDPDIAPVNNDCIVNAQDLAAVRNAFFSSPGAVNWNPDADFSGDGVVNILDLSIMIQFFFAAPGPGQPGNLCE